MSIIGRSTGAGDLNQYVLVDGTRAITGNIEMDHIGIGRAASVAHLLITSETFTTEDVTNVGIGNFPTFAPGIAGDNKGVSLQGNAWFDTVNWNAGSYVRCLEFFPAPSASGIGSANLDITGIYTAGLLNIAGRTVTAGDINAITAIPIANIIFGTDDTTADVIRGILIPSACATNGTWGELEGIKIEPQTTGVINRGLFLSGDDAGSDLVLGAAADASILYDGDDIVIDPQLVGTGGVRILSMKAGATQGAAGAAADELWKTDTHATLPDNVVMIGV